ncbi:MAG: carbon-nitrogen hydrolase family protein [Myxococcota bacterium]|nr:carbon-nitrogen hydrolase family protein [Myxococcota bacterium]
MARFAVVQVTATDDRSANLRTTSDLVRRAAGEGAEVICLPEMWPFVGSDAEKLAGAESLDGPSMTAMRELALELGVWMLPGSFAEISEVPDRVYNTAPVYDPSGALVGVYRKLHLFDVDIPGGAVFQESDTVTPGDRAVVVDTPIGRLGLTVCYDLRFPALYEALREGGAEIVLVPAAFTAHTGQAHWEVLLRARAIEQQVWVVAPNQGGRHNAKRESYGHSMIVDPWGGVAARVPEGPGIALGDVDPARVHRLRRELPCGSHKRPFQGP